MSGTTDDLDHHVEPRGIIDLDGDLGPEEIPYELRGLHNSGTWAILIDNMPRDSVRRLYDLLNQYKTIGERVYVILNTKDGSRGLQVDTFDLFSVQPMK